MGLAEAEEAVRADIAWAQPGERSVVEVEVEVEIQVSEEWVGQRQLTSILPPTFRLMPGCLEDRAVEEEEVEVAVVRDRATEVLAAHWLLVQTRL